MWCNRTVVLTWLQLRRIPVLFYQRSPFLFYAYIDILFCRWDFATEVCEVVYNFQSLASLSGDGPILFKTYGVCFIWVHVETNASCCLLQAMLQKFSLGRCIWEKRKIISIVCIYDGFRSISFASFFCEKPISFFRSVNLFDMLLWGT